MKKSADPNSDKMQAEFRQKLENYKAAPSENLWDKIELSLDKEEALVYKNRFRVYSRLAAACLVLLLAFAILFVPRKWEQLKNEEAEIAAVKSDQTKNAKPETAAPHLTDKNSPKSEISRESLALNTPETDQEETWSQTKNSVLGQPKTVGTKAQKVATRTAKSIAENAAKPALSPELIAANMASPETISKADAAYEEVALVAVSPAKSNAENTKAENSETMLETAENINVAVARVADENIQPEIETNNDQVAQNAVAGSSVTKVSAAKIMSPEVISDLSQVRAGSSAKQNSNITETTKTENNLALAVKKETEIPQVALAAAQEPVTEEKAEVVAEEKPEKEKKDNPKSGRWKVAASYGALSFNSGIRLTGRTFEPKPAGIGSGGNNYNQNISDYQTAIQEYNHETSAAYSQKGGVLVSFQMAKKWLLQTGFSYLQNREQTNSSYVFAKNPGLSYPASLTSDDESQTTLELVLSDNFDPNNSQVIPASEFATQYSYQYYSLPLNLRFQTDQQGLYYFAGAGGAFNFLDQTTVEIQEDPSNVNYRALTARVQPEKDEQPDVYRKSLLSVQLETGLGYQFSSHWSAELALTGNRFLKPLLSDKQMNGAKQQNARSYGATLNLGYTF